MTANLKTSTIMKSIPMIIYVSSCIGRASKIKHSNYLINKILLGFRLLHLLDLIGKMIGGKPC